MPQSLPARTASHSDFTKNDRKDESDNIEQHIRNTLDIGFNKISPKNNPIILNEPNSNLPSLINSSKLHIESIQPDIPVVSVTKESHGNILFDIVNPLPLQEESISKEKISLVEKNNNLIENDLNPNFNSLVKKINETIIKEKAFIKDTEEIIYNELFPTTTISVISTTINDLLEEHNENIMSDTLLNAGQSGNDNQNRILDFHENSLLNRETTTIIPEINVPTITNIDDENIIIASEKQSEISDIKLNQAKSLSSNRAFLLPVRAIRKPNLKRSQISNIGKSRLIGRRITVKGEGNLKNRRVRKKLKSVRKVINTSHPLPIIGNTINNSRVDAKIKLNKNRNFSAFRRPARRKSVLRRKIKTNHLPSRQKIRNKKPMKKEKVALFMLLDDYITKTDKPDILNITEKYHINNTEPTILKDDRIPVKRTFTPYRRKNFRRRHRFSKQIPIKIEDNSDKRNESTSTLENEMSVFVINDKILEKDLAKKVDKLATGEILDDPNVKIDVQVVSSHRKVSVSRKDSKFGVTTILKNVSPDKLKTFEDTTDVKTSSKINKPSENPINLTLTIDNLKDDLITTSEINLIEPKQQRNDVNLIDPKKQDEISLVERKKQEEKVNLVELKPRLQDEVNLIELKIHQQDELKLTEHKKQQQDEISLVERKKQEEKVNLVELKPRQQDEVNLIELKIHQQDELKLTEHKKQQEDDVTLVVPKKHQVDINLAEPKIQQDEVIDKKKPNDEIKVVEHKKQQVDNNLVEPRKEDGINLLEPKKEKENATTIKTQKQQVTQDRHTSDVIEIVTIIFERFPKNKTEIKDLLPHETSVRGIPVLPMPKLIETIDESEASLHSQENVTLLPVLNKYDHIPMKMNITDIVAPKSEKEENSLNNVNETKMYDSIDEIIISTDRNFDISSIEDKVLVQLGSLIGNHTQDKSESFINTTQISTVESIDLKANDKSSFDNNTTEDINFNNKSLYDGEFLDELEATLLQEGLTINDIENIFQSTISPELEIIPEITTEPVRTYIMQPMPTQNTVINKINATHLKNNQSHPVKSVAELNNEAIENDFSVYIFTDIPKTEDTKITTESSTEGIDTTVSTLTTISSLDNEETTKKLMTAISEIAIKQIILQEHISDIATESSVSDTSTKQVELPIQITKKPLPTKIIADQPTHSNIMKNISESHRESADGKILLSDKSFNNIKSEAKLRKEELIGTSMLYKTNQTQYTKYVKKTGLNDTKHIFEASLTTQIPQAVTTFTLISEDVKSINIIPQETTTPILMIQETTHARPITSKDEEIKLSPRENTKSQNINIQNEFVDIDLNLLTEDIEQLILQTDEEVFSNDYSSTDFPESTTNLPIDSPNITTYSEINGTNIIANIANKNGPTEINVTEGILKKVIKHKAKKEPIVKDQHLLVDDVRVADNLTTAEIIYTDKQINKQDEVQNEIEPQNLGKSLKTDSSRQSLNKELPKEKLINSDLPKIDVKHEIMNGLLEKVTNDFHGLILNSQINTGGPIVNRLLEELIKSVILEKLRDPSIDKIIDTHIKSALNFGFSTTPTTTQVVKQIKKHHPLLEKEKSSPVPLVISTVLPIEITTSKSQTNNIKLDSTTESISTLISTLPELIGTTTENIIEEIQGVIKKDIPLTHDPINDMKKETETESEPESQITTSTETIIRKDRKILQGMISQLDKIISDNSKVPSMAKEILESINLQLHSKYLNQSDVTDSTTQVNIALTSEIPQEVETTTTIIKTLAPLIKKTITEKISTEFPINEIMNSLLIENLKEITTYKFIEEDTTEETTVPIFTSTTTPSSNLWTLATTEKQKDPIIKVDSKLLGKISTVRIFEEATTEETTLPTTTIMTTTTNDLQMLGITDNQRNRVLENNSNLSRDISNNTNVSSIDNNLNDNNNHLQNKTNQLSLFTISTTQPPDIITLPLVIPDITTSAVELLTTTSKSISKNDDKLIKLKTSEKIKNKEVISFENIKQFKKIKKPLSSSNALINDIKGKSITSFFSQNKASQPAFNFFGNGSPFSFVPRVNPAFALTYRVGKDAPPALNHFVLPQRFIGRPLQSSVTSESSSIISTPSKSVPSISAPLRSIPSKAVPSSKSNVPQHFVAQGFGVPLNNRKTRQI